MKDPVLLETGCVYDRASILRWFQSSHTCPCTRLPVNVDAMVPLFELAQEIAACSPSEKTREREDPPNVTHPICAPPDIAFQLGQLASTSNPSIRLRILQSLTHRMHRTPRLERDLCMQLINHGAVHILTSILLHQETSSTLCVYTADLLSILSTYPGVDAMLLQAANGSNLLPHPLVFSTTKPKCCSMTAKRLAMVVGMLDPHTPGCKDVTCGMLWALWLVTPWSHLRTHLVKRTKMLKVLHAHVSMHIEGIERRGVEHANVKALVAACHVLRSLALVGAGAEGMVGTLYAMRSAMIKWCGGGGVDDDDAARLVIMDTQSQLFNILTSTFASALANACFMLRRAGGARGGGLGRLLGVGSHSASQQFLQSTAVDHSTLRAVQWLLRVAMMRDDPDVLGMHAACALLRSMLISPTAVHAALRAGLGAVMLRGCASQDEVVCLSSARVAVVMATEGGDGGRVTMGVMGGVTTAAMLMMRGDECGVLGGKLLAALLCVRTVDFFVAEGVWTMLVGLLGAGGDDPRVHSAAHLVLQVCGGSVVGNKCVELYISTTYAADFTRAAICCFRHHL